MFRPVLAVSFVTPVIAVLLGVTLMREKMSPELLIGMVFIASGIILLNRPAGTKSVESVARIDTVKEIARTEIGQN